MSRTVHYDTNGNEIDTEESIDDAPTYAQEQLKYLGEKEELMVTGNTVKYIARCGRKSDKVLEDLKKAAWYLNREIERMERE